MKNIKQEILSYFKSQVYDLKQELKLEFHLRSQMKQNINFLKNHADEIKSWIKWLEVKNGK